jgi:hypothetical protein
MLQHIAVMMTMTLLSRSTTKVHLPPVTKYPSWQVSVGTYWRR